MAEGEEAQSKSLFPGEKQKMLLSPDKLIMAFAPQPTRMPYECLPRYMMRLQTIDLDESVTQCIDESFLKYMEGKTIRLTGDLSSQKTIWLKPRVTAPQGFTLWCASNFRSIQLVSRADYFQNVKGLC